MASTHLPFSEFPAYMRSQKILPKYNAEQEEKIPHPYWDLDKDNIGRIVASISDEVKAVLKDYPEDDKELHQLHDAGVRLPKINRSQSVKVALLGNQGAGKSLLINTLFDYDGLSLTGADGGACTSSVVKYLFYPGDEKGFRAEVKFLTASKITALIKEHAKSYYDYYDSYENPDEDEQKKGAQEEDLDLKLKNTAEEFFETLFGSKQEFLESWNARAYEIGEFLSLSLLKYEDALHQIDANENMKTFSEQDQYSLNKKLLPFLSKVDSQLCLWPLVDNVSIRITHPLLQHGIELIDLPGSGDTNASRTRHADEIKDSVDVLIVLADTIRITTDESFINRARGAILTHGLENVKLVATKIDALTDNQLAQCSGSVYDHIKQEIIKFEDQIQKAEENDDSAEQTDLLNRYVVYLNRYMKSYKITERAKEISDTMITTKSRVWPTGEAPEMFHISAASYMNWIKKETILFSHQPALSPSQTGIPAIRRLLYHLPAKQNFEDIASHVNISVPTFIEKLKRATTHSDRDAGFRTLADEFDSCIRRDSIRHLSTQARKAFSDRSKNSIRRLSKDAVAYKAQVEVIIRGTWLCLRHASLGRALKMRGTVPKGTSKAAGLDAGCNWNLELATLLAPGFRGWAEEHSKSMVVVKDGLCQAIIGIHDRAMANLGKSAANLLIVDKARNKWRPYRNKLLVKVQTLIEQIARCEKKTQLWATMEAQPENSLVASVTDTIYDMIFESKVPLRESTSKKGSNSKPKAIMSLVQYRKSEMQRLMLEEDNHIVDTLIEKFKSTFDSHIETFVSRFFTEVEEILENYSNWLREQAPINYPITPVGSAVRESLQELIPSLEEKMQELKELMPELPSTDTDDSQETTDFFSDIKACSTKLGGSSGRNSKALPGLSGSKRKLKEEESDTKRIKSEFRE